MAFLEHLAPLVVMTLAVIAGTWAGTRLLERVTESLFLLLYRVALTLAALYLIFAALI